MVEHKTHTFDDDGKCACGYTCSHENVDEDGKCEDCKKQMAAAVIISGKTTYYTDTQAAVNAAVGGTVKLLADGSADENSFSKGQSLVLDLNGHQLSSNTSSFKIFSSDMTIRDSSDSGTGSIYGLEVLTGSKLRVESGYVSAANIDRSAAVSLSGGTYGNMSVSHYDTYNGECVGAFAAPGYSFKGSGGWISADQLLGDYVGSTFTIEKSSINGLSLENVNATYGTAATLGISMDAAGMPTFQWYKLGETAWEAITGANSYTYTAPADLPCGTYTYICAATGTDGSVVLSNPATLTVSKQDISNAEVTTGKLTYNGTEQTPAVTVKIGGKTLTEGTDYTVTLDKQTNAGTYHLTVEGTGNYTGKVENVEWKIAPKTVASLTINVASCTYNGLAQTPSVELKDGDTIIPTSEYTVTYSNNINAGTATVAVKSKDGGNYQLDPQEGMSLTKNFTIEKAEAPAMQPAELTVVNGVEKLYLFDLPELPTLPEPCEYGSVKYEADGFALTGGYANSTATMTSENKLQLAVPQVDSEDEDFVGTVTIKITTDNYQDITLTCNFTAKNKLTPVVDGTVSASAITYGQALSESTITGKMKDPDTGAEVTGTFAWTDDTVKPSADNGDRNTTADWVFTPDAPEYVTATGTIRVVVNKAQFTNVSVEQDGTLTYNGEAQTASVKTAFTAADNGNTIRFGYSAGPLKVGLG